MLISSLMARPLIALVTLAIGVFSANIFDYPSVVPVVDMEESVYKDVIPLRINACELGAISDEPIGKPIVLDATIWHVFYSSKELGSEDFVMIEPRIQGCAHYDVFVNTELDLQNYVGPNLGLDANLGHFKREVDVRIWGTVKRSEKKYSDVIYRIVPEKIELISPFRKFTPKGAA